MPLKGLPPYIPRFVGLPRRDPPHPPSTGQGLQLGRNASDFLFSCSPPMDHEGPWRCVHLAHFSYSRIGWNPKKEKSSSKAEGTAGGDSRWGPGKKGQKYTLSHPLQEQERGMVWNCSALVWASSLCLFHSLWSFKLQIWHNQRQQSASKKREPELEFIGFYHFFWSHGNSIFA